MYVCIWLYVFLYFMSLVVNTTLVASDIYCCDLYASFLNLTGESLFSCMTNPLAEVGKVQEGDRQIVTSLDEVDNAIQGEHSNLQGELSLIIDLLRRESRFLRPLQIAEVGSNKLKYQA